MPSLSQLSAMSRSILLDHLLQRAWGYSMRLLLRVGIKSVVIKSWRGDVDATLAPTVSPYNIIGRLTLSSFFGNEEDGGQWNI